MSQPIGYGFLHEASGKFMGPFETEEEALSDAALLKGTPVALIPLGMAEWEKELLRSAWRMIAARNASDNSGV